MVTIIRRRASVETDDRSVGTQLSSCFMGSEVGNFVSEICSDVPTVGLFLRVF